MAQKKNSLPVKKAITEIKKTPIQYKLIKPFPLQKVGDLVVELKGNWQFEKSNSIISLLILNSDYFEPIYLKFVIGKEMMYKNAAVKIKGFSNNNYIVSYLHTKLDAIVKETDLSEIEIYWFFNSKLQIFKENIISNNKKNDFIERKAVGNAFKTKEEVQSKVKLILEIFNK